MNDFIRKDKNCPGVCDFLMEGRRKRQEIIADAMESEGRVRYNKLHQEQGKVRNQ